MTRKISHIGILVHDVDAAAKLWTEAFGLKKFEDRRIEVEGIRSVFISVGGSWDEMVIEIMEPLDKSNMENALSRRLAKVGVEGAIVGRALYTGDIKLAEAIATAAATKG